ncbi:MAG: hypothetical protein RLY43_745, partial [Bacteroidota bacterium]
GVGKTHSIKNIIRPLDTLNSREVKAYNEKLKEYKAWLELDKHEKKQVPKVDEPRRTEFMLNDATIEALFDAHDFNKIGVGIMRDELSGWIKDLNKYRPGSDLELYLSCWSNQPMSLTRKTSRSSYVANAYVPIIGGVQPGILSMHYTNENKDNGFIDRILICAPDISVDKYNEQEISEELIRNYDEWIMSIFDNIRKNWVRFDSYDNIAPYLARFSEDAKKEWVRIFNYYTELQNGDIENEYTKSMIPKLKSYIARFSLLLNTLYTTVDDKNYEINIISKESVLGAEKLGEYFFKMAKKNKAETRETGEMREIIKVSGKITIRDKFEALYKSNKTINKSKIAEELGVSRVTINAWIKDIEKK